MTTTSTPRRLFALLLCACVLALPACDSDDSSEDAAPETITYSVTGDGPAVVVYTDANGSTNTVSQAELPFEQEAAGFTSGSVATVTSGPADEGSVTVQILSEDGDVLDEATATGLGSSAQAIYEFD